MAKCSRCKGYSSSKGLCDNCAWANMVETRIKKRKDPNHKESPNTKKFFDDSIAQYNKLSKMKKGFFD